MDTMTCSKGHRYDPSISSECPECARLGNKTIPLVGGLSFAEPGFDTYGKTEPVHAGNGGAQGGFPGATMPVNPMGGSWADADSYDAAGRFSDEMVTMPLNVEQVAGARQPVAGWIVCIKGASKGADFRIHEQNNYVGRSQKMDICIPGDPTISRENHAIITYDPRSRKFFTAPLSGNSIVYVNDTPALGTTELHSYDRIEIGESIFLFVAFCGEQFQWEA